MTDTTRDPNDLAQRLTRLESQLDEFEHEIADIWELLGTRSASTRETSPPPVPSVTPEPITASLPPERSATPEPSAPIPVPAKPTSRDVDLDIEALLSGRALSWIGGLAILIGSLFFLRLASAHDTGESWVGPGIRVLIGLIAGSAMIAGGALLFERRERLFGHTLLAVGLGVFNLALFAATGLYDLVAYQAALAGTLIAATVGASVAIRARSQVAAAYGLLPALISPALFDAEPTGVTIAYLGVLLTGTTVITLYRTWTWLPLLSLLFTFFQLYAWLSDSPGTALGLAIIASYWLLHMLGSGGEEIGRLRNRARPGSMIVTIVNTAVAFGAGFILLDGRLEEWRGLYLIALAALHLPIAGYLFYRSGDRHPFGMLTMGLGLATGAVAIPVQFNGEAVPIAWAAVGVVMLWLYGRLCNRFNLGAGVAFGALAIAHVVLLDYPYQDFLSGTTMNGYPFVNKSGAVLGALVLALAASVYLARSKDILNAAILVGAGLLAYALPYELTGGWMIAGWSLLALILVAVHRIEPSGHPRHTDAGLALSAFALLVTLSQIATPSRLRVSRFSEIDHFPFWSDATLALASLATALIVAGLLNRQAYPQITRFALVTGAGLVVYLLSIGLVDEFQKRVTPASGNLGSLREQAQVGLSILWTTCGVASFALGVALRRIGIRVYGLGLLGIAIVKVFIVDLASLDAFYRVVSFIALGILLLLASYLYQRIMTRTNGDASAGASA